ncbi:YcbK family protein [Corticibacterium sp. UT-5YL-CI-8]|nr:YcbK family protein [Tianweitania sp. UT-5YL-CI-8]
MSVLLASCTSTTDPDLQAGMPGFNAAVAPTVEAGAPNSTTLAGSSVPAKGYQLAMSKEGDTALPDQMAYVPASNPTEQPGEKAAEAAAVEEQKPKEPAPVQQAETQSTTPTQTAETTAEAKPETQTATAAAEPAPQQQGSGQILTNGTLQEPPKKKGFFASLFRSTPAAAKTPEKPKPVVAEAVAKPEQILENTPKPVIAEAEETKPVVTLASTRTDKGKTLAMASLSSPGSGAMDTLPGVRQSALFEIKRRSGLDDDSDVDLHEDEDDGSFQVASAAGFARLAPNGLIKQTESVDVACLKPSLVRVLKAAEQRYGKKAVVTSGYRNPDRNRRARGAKNSLHMYCAAADVQIPGVSKLELANYFRAMPGRGGVGTYCHTNSVHIDVGPERDWNWRCRRKR